MPEGPEVETVRRNLEKRLLGQEIESIWRSAQPLRTPSKSESFRFLQGDRICTLSRVGKALLVETDHTRGILVRFGMSGRLFFPKIKDPVEKHTHLRIRFKESDSELRYIDPRRFGDLQPFKDALTKNKLLADMGPDGILLSDDLIKTITEHIKRSQRPIKAVLLDQSVVSGIGNIYACEALYLAQVSPEKLACDLSIKAIDRIIRASRDVMKGAVSNGGTTFLSYLDGNGQKGKNQNHLRVFGRENEPCPRCKNRISRIVQSGRSTFYCAHCQK